MVSEVEYKLYIEKSSKIITSLLAQCGARPVLFVGSGMTRRYLNGPSWRELLEKIAQRASIPDDKFAYLAQKAGQDWIELGTLLSSEVHQWAFGAGRNSFPKTYFSAESDQDAFIKFLASQILDELTPNIIHLSQALAQEVRAFQKIAPHAVITTNFDKFLEDQFPEYKLVIGEEIIPLSTIITGELYKIHGTTSDPMSLVLTRRDYERFIIRRRYISAKLMTYFAEFPVFIFGYGFGDSNINSIIGDLGEAMRSRGGLLQNIFLVKRIEDLEATSSLQEEHAIPSNQDSSTTLRVRTILTKDFTWIFELLGDTKNPIPVPLSTLRHLAARVVELVRVDIPKQRMELDFEHIKSLTEDSSKLGMLLGIGKATSPSMSHPYSITQIGKALGFRTWHPVKPLLRSASEKVGYDIESSDNDYHVSIRPGESNSKYHKYSKSLLDLLKDLRKGK